MCTVQKWNNRTAAIQYILHFCTHALSLSIPKISQDSWLGLFVYGDHNKRNTVEQFSPVKAEEPLFQFVSILVAFKRVRWRYKFHIYWRNGLGLDYEKSFDRVSVVLIVGLLAIIYAFFACTFDVTYR